MSIRIFLIALFCCTFTILKAQIKLTSGQYTTEDGLYTVTINFEMSTLTLIEPNRTSIYVKTEGNEFRFTHPTSKTVYGIEVMDPSTIQTFKPGTSAGRYTIRLSNADATASNEQFKTYFAMAERYKAKMTSDAKDAQLWSFCAAAAMARSSMNEEGFKDYAAKISLSIKQLIINKTKCPCADAIPTEIWNNAN